MSIGKLVPGYKRRSVKMHSYKVNEQEKIKKGFQMPKYSNLAVLPNLFTLCSFLT